MSNTPPNPVFADHVHATAFNLTLGKTHIRALAHLVSGDPLWTENHISHYPPPLDGLRRRGLVVSIDTGDLIHQRWELTRAGELVVALLAESGALIIYTPTPDPHVTEEVLLT